MGANETKTISVNVDPGESETENVGCGFTLVDKNDTELIINLTTSSGIIVKSELVSSAPNQKWTQISETQWKAIGVKPTKEFWCIIKAQVAKEGEQGGGEIWRWMSVSDVKLDAEGLMEYPTTGPTDNVIRLIVPLNDDNDFSWSIRDFGSSAFSSVADTKARLGTDDDVLETVLKINAKKSGQFTSAAGYLWIYDKDGNRDVSFITTAFDHSVTAGAFKKSLYIESTGESGVTDEFTVWFKPDAPAGGYWSCDTIRYLLVGTDIDVNSNNSSGGIENTNIVNSGQDFRENHPVSELTFYPEFRYGMVVMTTDDSETDDDIVVSADDDLKPLVLRSLKLGADDNDVRRKVMNTLNPRIIVEQVGGTGKLRVFTKNENPQENPQLVWKDTSSGVLSKLPNDDTLWEALRGNDDVELQVRGLEPGEVILEIRLQLQGTSGPVIHRDSVRITVMGLKNIKVYDPKLAGNTKADINYHLAGNDTRAQLLIMDGTTTVATLLAKTDTPVCGQWATVQWNGTWDNGPHSGKYADPKQYTVRLRVYYSATATVPVTTRDVPIYVVRLGVQQIGFTDTQDLIYHKKGPTSQPTDLQNYEVEDIPWTIKDIDFLKSDANARPRTEPKKQKNAVGACFSDDDNSGTWNGSEWFLDVDGNNTYNTNLRQVNFPGQKPDPSDPTDKNKTGGVDTENWNRPVVYVRGSDFQPWFTLGAHAISDLTGANVDVGYPVTTYPIRVIVEYRGASMVGIAQTSTTNILNVSPQEGPYELKGAKLDNTVGHAVETMTFRFQYNAKKETFVDTNGNGKFDVGEPLVDANGNGKFDEDWRDIPGSQTTSHLVYRLADAPEKTVLAKAQQTFAQQQQNVPGHSRLYLKIVDFTCVWGAGKTSAEDVFDSYWKTGKFWTPFHAPGGGDRQPNNANGFYGTGDPTERNRLDMWGNAPKSYSYQHNMGNGNGYTVDWLLDHNQGRCGAWAPFLMAFMATHGLASEQQVFPLMKWRFVAANGNESFEEYAAAEAHMNAGQRPGGAAAQIGDQWYRPLGIFVNADGQANPYKVVNQPNNPHLRSFWGCFPNFNLTDHVFVKYNGRFYDPSYDHANGVSHATINEKADAGVSHYYYNEKLVFGAGGRFVDQTNTLPVEWIWFGENGPNDWRQGRLLKIANDPNAEEMEEP